MLTDTGQRERERESVGRDGGMNQIIRDVMLISQRKKNYLFTKTKKKKKNPNQKK